jgi:hypothetical protein
LDKWAWEFLRRNPDYYGEYRELMKGLTEEQRLMKECFDIGCRNWGLYSWLDPDREYTGIRFIPTGGTEAIISTLDFPKGKGIVFKFAGKNTGEILFRFDTRKPINPQIDVAKKKLLKLQKNQTGECQAIFKPRTFGTYEDWLVLLRVLDAKAEGNKLKTIAKAFYPNEEITSTKLHRIKEISDKIRQAERYTNHDYRLIPFLSK